MGYHFNDLPRAYRAHAHGHVAPREDGGKKGCGGPVACAQCRLERAYVELKEKYEQLDRQAVALAAPAPAPVAPQPTKLTPSPRTLPPSRVADKPAPALAPVAEAQIREQTATAEAIFDPFVRAEIQKENQGNQNAE